MNKYTRQIKYMEKLKNFSFREKPDVLKAFEDKCKANGTTPTTELRKFIKEYTISDDIQK